jgi:hypothetical protein
MERKEYNDKVKALRDAVDLDVSIDDLEGMQGKVLMLTRMIGLGAELQARALMNLKSARLVAYAQHKSEGLSPNVMKLVVEGETAEEEAKYELVDRLGSGLVHALDGLRTIISLKKTEMDKSL